MIAVLVVTVGPIAVPTVVAGARRASAPVRIRVASTVYDPVSHVNWLADADLPARMKLGLPINRDGSMSFQTAVKWVRRLDRRKYLGHNNWTLPITPTPYSDNRCSGRNMMGGGSFGLGCSKSPLARLYKRILGLRWPDTAVAIPDTTTGPFHDFQPYLYWTGTPAKPTGKPAPGSLNSGGFDTVSFNTGFPHTANQTDHYMYVLPVLAGNQFGGTALTGLQAVEGGQAVWQPGAGPGHVGLTWLADADLARTQHFSLHDKFGKDGSVEGDTEIVKGKTFGGTAGSWVQALSTDKWLAKQGWSLPTPDELTALYKALSLSAQEPVVPVPNATLKGFRDIQPYLYWSCAGKHITGSCHGAPNKHNQQWSFSFGNGYLGTDVTRNQLYVIVYYHTPTRPPITRCPPSKPGQPILCT